MRFLLKLLCLVVFMCLCQSARPLNKRRNSRNASKLDYIWKDVKSKCELQTCGQMIPAEAYNCVNECLSPKCYAEVYKDNPLEDGEVDLARDRSFVTCLRNELKEKDSSAAKSL